LELNVRIIGCSFELAAVRQVFALVCPATGIEKITGELMPSPG
jgi:hypothetical protein